jgi:hypothetical protein
MPILRTRLTPTSVTNSRPVCSFLCWGAVALLSASASPAFAEAPRAPAIIAPEADAAAAADCEQAGEQAERDFALPRGLLLAIGRVESGRKELRTGRYTAWPWAINAQGQGMLLESRDEAVNQVRSLQARGIRSIDIGCFQINLLHHPNAFRGVEEGFDARRNASYAGQFLTFLFARTGNWNDAVAAYHSAEPERGSAYRARVFASWTGSDQVREPARPARRAADPVTVLSTFLPSVRVWRPGVAGDAAGLPRVTSPGTANRMLSLP